MYEQQVKYLSAAVDAQNARNLVRSVLFLLRDDGCRMPVTAQSDLIGNVSHFEYVRCRLQVRDKGSDTRDPFHVTFVVQFAQCAIGGHARHAGRTDQTFSDGTRSRGFNSPREICLMIAASIAGSAARHSYSSGFLQQVPDFIDVRSARLGMAMVAIDHLPLPCTITGRSAT
jgi:hypothetical protein